MIDQLINILFNKILSKLKLYFLIYHALLKHIYNKLFLKIQKLFKSNIITLKYYKIIINISETVINYL